MWPAMATIDQIALILFGIQFVWQFPHFWAIAWVLDDDYKLAGFRLLPTGKRDLTSAMITFVMYPDFGAGKFAANYIIGYGGY